MTTTYEGIASMYLSMSMCGQPLPLLGTCIIQEKKLILKFPLTTVSFDLPEAPRDGQNDVSLKLAGPKGEMNLKMSFKPDLNGFVGECIEGGSKTLAFVAQRPNGPLKHLRSL